ncbi:MAG: hypothetical protein JNM66_11830 [Bryobacterales bacterium]|nr:hypothetical protein [Bryobacterales bacterium]
MAVSFSNDIAPIFNQFRSQMLWRFDVTNYDHVKANAAVIYGRISDKGYPMPPPPMDPLSDAQVALFKQWMDTGCAP